MADLQFIGNIKKKNKIKNTNLAEQFQNPIKNRRRRQNQYTYRHIR